MTNDPKTEGDIELTAHSLDDERARIRWESLWQRSPQRSPFSTRPYAAAISSLSECACSMHLMTRDRIDIGGWLVFSQKKGPFLRAIVPPFTPYTSLLTSAPLPESLIHTRPNGFTELLDKLARQHDGLRFHLHPAWTDVRLFQWHRWHASPLYTYRSDLSQIDEHLSTWSESARRHFRRHADAYALIENPDASAYVIDLCVNSYRKNERAFPTSPRLAHRLVEVLQQYRMVRTFTVKHVDEEMASGGLLVLHADTEAYYWLAGSNPGPAMTVLLGRLLPLLKAEGFRIFDFVGANTRSIAEFKRRLGPTLVPYFALTCFPNRWLGMMDTLKQFR